MANDPIIGPAVIRRPWTQQPPAGTEIDWTHPLAKKMTFVFCPNEIGKHYAHTPRGRVLGTVTYEGLGGGTGPFPVHGSNTLPRAKGSALSVEPTEGWSSLTFPMREEYSPADGQLSCYYLGETLKPPGTSSQDYWWYIDTSLDNTDGWRVLKYISPSTNIRFRLPNGASNTEWTGHTWAVGDTLSLGFTYDSTTQKIYDDGAEVASDTRGTGDITTAATVLNLFDANDNSYDSAVSYRILILWNRCVTPAEMAEIDRNPWQIYKPQEIYIPKAPDLKVLEF